MESTYSASEAMTSLAKAAPARKYSRRRGVWWLMADLCSMMLDVANRNEPYRPIWSWGP
ncbi:DUF7380 domain-containing protein [Pseudomonas silesiensis]|uniref:DUF7380 domain-containing protein n=1 Tax=Pseudomonas silesiensis TaxID=1853130 RepID=UPI003F7609FC